MFLFIHSIIGQDYDTLMHKLAVVVLFWLLVMAAMAADLMAGVHKARRRGELRSSQGFKRTVSKFVTYYSALMLALAVDCAAEYLIVSFDSFVPCIPYATIVMSLYIIVFVEGRSILEKAGDKQRRQLADDLELLGTLLDELRRDRDRRAERRDTP